MGKQFKEKVRNDERKKDKGLREEMRGSKTNAIKQDGVMEEERKG